MGWRRVSRAPASSGAPESWPSSRRRSTTPPTARPSLAFLAGESGVGKSRLLAELERRAREDGARVLVGDAIELGEGELPYAPLVGALRPLARERRPPSSTSWPAATAAELATLLPELGAATDAAPLGADDERAAQRAALRGAPLAARAPRRASARSCSRSRTSTGPTARPAPSSPSSPAACATSACSSSRPTAPTSCTAATRCARCSPSSSARRAPRRIELAPLRPRRARPSSSRTSSARRPRRTSSTACSRAARATRSSPRSSWPPARRARRPAPHPARRAHGPRRAPARHGAGGAAAAGRRAQRSTTQLLEDASGLEPRELREALRDAVESHIAVVADEGRHTFRHALLREVIVDDLLPGERSALHLALAHAFERRFAEDPAARGSRRASPTTTAPRATSPPRSRPPSRRRSAADDVRAHGEAAALLERALELWDRVPDAEEHAASRRVDLLLRAGPRPLPRERRRARRDAHGAALAEIDEEAEPRRASEVLGDLAPCAGPSAAATTPARRSRTRSSCFRRTSAAGSARSCSSTRRASRCSRAATARRGRRPRDALAAIDAAGADELYAAARSTASASRSCATASSTGRTTLRDALDLAREPGCPPRWPSRTRTSPTGCTSPAAAARRSRSPTRGSPSSPIRRPGRRRGCGTGGRDDRLRPRRLGRGAAPHPAPGARAAGIRRVNALMREAELELAPRRRHDARPDAARRDRRARRDDARAAVHRRRRRAAGRAGAPGGQPGRGARVVEGAGPAGVLHRGRRFLSQVAATGAAIEADAAERARDVGDDAARDDALARLEPLLLRVEAAALDGRPMEAANLATANAEATRGRGEPDPAAWAAAAEAWAAASRPYPEAQARRREAEAHVAAGDREAAAVAAGAALATARALGSAGSPARPRGSSPVPACGSIRPTTSRSPARRRPRRSRSG